MARDVVGLEPLYWGENERYRGFASERKALWKIGIRNASPVPPGDIVLFSNRAMSQFRAVTLRRPEIIDMSLEDAAEALRKTLQTSHNLCLENTRGVGVLFSGGVDSALVAKCVVDSGVRPMLYVAGLEGSHDIEAAERSAKELGCPLHERAITLDEVEDYIPKVVYAVEESDLMKIGVGLPLYVAAESAANKGDRALFSGQGVDELFGGYSRYCRVLRNGGEGALEQELWNDVLGLADVNLQRDKGIALANNINLILPFLDLNIVQFALGLPTHLKVRNPEDSLRKHVVRRTARLLGLSEDIAMSPKRAMQYGSGSHRAIRSISRTRGYRNPRDYISSVFKEVFRSIAD